MPPKNIDASDLWVQLTMLPRAHRIIESPLMLGDEAIPMAMMVLTQSESQECTIEAERFTRKMLKEVPKSDEMSEGYRNLYETRAAAEILFRACRKHNKVEEKFFPSVNDIAKKLTTDQIGVLMQQYIVVQQELGPIVAKMSQEEFDAWVEKLAKGGSAHFLGFLTSAAQNQFIVSMASQLYKLQMDKCSATLPLEENTKSE